MTDLRRLRSNMSSGIISSGWTALSALIVVPIYLHLFGREGYGLISFFVTLQGLFLIFDFGLSTTINREVAKSNVRGEFDQVRSTLQTFAVIYWLSALLMFIVIASSSSYITRVWLNVPRAGFVTVETALLWMGAAIGLRWPVGIYLGVLMGVQHAVRANVLAILTTTASTFGAIVVLWMIGPSIIGFFAWQALVALVQVIAMRRLAWRALPSSIPARVDFRGTRPLWAFSGGIAGATVMGALVIQLDKLMLPRYVPLSSVGTYGVGNLIARPVLLLMMPVFAALYPYLTTLAAAGRSAELQAIYRPITRAMAAMLFAFATYSSLLAPDLVLLWTGDATMSEQLRIAAPLLIFGMVLNALMYLPHALQLAYGRADVPVVINAVLLVFLGPALLILLPRFGIVGAAAAWAAVNVLNAALSIALTHRTILPELALKWTGADLLLPLAICLGVIGGGQALIPHNLGPVAAIMALAPFAIAAVFLGAGTSATIRKQVRGALRIRAAKPLASRKILLVAGSFPPSPCGVGDYTAALAQALSSLPRTQVAVLTAWQQGSDIDHQDGGPALLPGLSNWHLRQIVVLARTMRSWRPTVVHLQYPAQGFGNAILPSFVPLLGWFMGAQVVRTWHEPMTTPQQRSRGALLKFALQAVVPGPIIVVRPNFRELMGPTLSALIGPSRMQFIAGASAIPRSQLTSHEADRLRRELAGTQSRLVAFFGFLYPQKGVELLFDIADPERDHLLIIGEAGNDSSYLADLQYRAASDLWKGRVTFTGYLEENAIADRLRAADAVVLPFREGAGTWNSSLSAALIQGTFTIATTNAAAGFDPERNLYLAAIDDIAEMRSALLGYAGKESHTQPDGLKERWRAIAEYHVAVYEC